MAKLDNLEFNSLGGGAREVLLNLFYPIGSIFQTTNSNFDTVDKVKAQFGGTWKKLEGRFLLGASSSYSLGATGGSKDAVVVSHNHSIASGGAHYHVISDKGCHGLNGNSSWARYSDGNTQSNSSTMYTNGGSPDGAHTHTVDYNGEDGTNKNMPPYQVIYMYERTA